MTKRLPAWMEQKQCTELPEGCARAYSRADYLEKMLASINRIISEDADSNSIFNSNGILRCIDPHIKLIGIMALILATALTKSIDALVVLNMVILGTALQSGIRFTSFGMRVWLPTLLLTGFTVLPGVISWITPGEPLYVFYSGGYEPFGLISLPAELAVTKQGVQSAFFVILRSASSLGLANLMIQTTRWTLLTKVLAKFGLPSAVVAILDLTYRYIYLFLLLLLDYLMGRKSRLVGIESQSAKISWIGGTIASFLRITREYSQEINYAMQSRGYYGEYYSDLAIRIQIIDIFFLLIVAVLCYCAYGGSMDVWNFSL